MKKIFSFACMLLMLVGCSNETETPEIVATGVAPVTVNVSGFTILQEDISVTKAVQSVESYSGIKAITLAFYAQDGTETYKRTQVRSDADTYTTFGSFATSLTLGSYTMVVIAYGSEEEITLTSPTSASFTADKCRETFTYTRSVTVSSTDAMNLDATLERQIAMVVFQATDLLPSVVKKARITFSGGGKSFNPTTGLAIESGLVNEITVSSSNVGLANRYTSYLFLNSDSQSMDIAIDILDADENVLFHKSVSGVSLRRNRATTLRGVLYTSDVSSTFSVDTDWLEGIIIDF